jgi:hypothetical protein
MRRYFFHVIRGDVSRVTDDEGLELPDDEVATREAALAVTDLAENGELTSEDVESDVLQIVDDLGRVVVLLPLRDLLAGRLHSFVLFALALIGLSLFGSPQQLFDVLARSSFYV